MKQPIVLFTALFCAGILSYVPSLKADDESAPKGFFLGGVTGAAVGGAAAGAPGAAVGGVSGAFLGTAIGASRDRKHVGDAKLDTLYDKRDSLMDKIEKTDSEKRREKYQKELVRINERIQEQEGRYDRSQLHRGRQPKRSPYQDDQYE